MAQLGLPPLASAVCGTRFVRGSTYHVSAWKHHSPSQSGTLLPLTRITDELFVSNGWMVVRRRTRTDTRNTVVNLFGCVSVPGLKKRSSPDRDTTSSFSSNHNLYGALSQLPPDTDASHGGLPIQHTYFSNPGLFLMLWYCTSPAPATTDRTSSIFLVLNGPTMRFMWRASMLPCSGEFVTFPVYSVPPFQ